MKLTDLTTHRPYPLPAGPWVMSQTWENLLFAHWPLAPDALRPLLPPGLELDTFDGHAYIGIVPFEMTHIHARGLPPIPGTSAFPELNVRTYVTLHDKPGVYFFSLDAAHRLAVATARRFFHLPYFNADMAVRHENNTTHYTSTRTHRRANPADFIVQYRPISEVFHSTPYTLDHWLTARYCLYTNDRQGRLYRGDIHHVPWPLQQAEAEIQTNTMAEAARLHLPATDPLLHYSRQLETLIWPLVRL